MIFLWKMLNNAPGTLFKEPNIVVWPWKLCSQLFKNLKSVNFYIKLSSFSFLNQCPGAPVSVTLLINGCIYCAEVLNHDDEGLDENEFMDEDDTLLN
jgi:hypothetical protein